MHGDSSIEAEECDKLLKTKRNNDSKKEKTITSSPGHGLGDQNRRGPIATTFN